jgi:hypothetical protein
LCQEDGNCVSATFIEPLWQVKSINKNEMHPFCGERTGGTITNCFWDTETSGMPNSNGGTGKTTAQMQTESTFTSAGWDFSDGDGNPAIWRMPINDYPHLAWEPEADCVSCLDIDGNGAADALTDGILILRYLFGFSGATLIDGAVAPDCTRCTAPEIEAYLENLMP